MLESCHRRCVRDIGATGAWDGVSMWCFFDGSLWQHPEVPRPARSAMERQLAATADWNGKTWTLRSAEQKEDTAAEAEVSPGQSSPLAQE